MTRGATTGEGALYYVVSDQISRPVSAWAEDGTKVWSAVWDPFGGLASEWTHASLPAPTIGLRFPGQWVDGKTGLHQNWMRDYDPTTGRYLQGDPLGLVDGSSVYGYVGQRPLRYVDPRGEDKRRYDERREKAYWGQEMRQASECVRQCVAEKLIWQEPNYLDPEALAYTGLCGAVGAGAASLTSATAAAVSAPAGGSGGFFAWVFTTYAVGHTCAYVTSKASYESAYRKAFKEYSDGCRSECACDGE